MAKKRKKAPTTEELMALVRRSAKDVAELDKVLRKVFRPPPPGTRIG